MDLRELVEQNARAVVAALQAAGAFPAQAPAAGAFPTQAQAPSMPAAPLPYSYIPLGPPPAGPPMGDPMAVLRLLLAGGAGGVLAGALAPPAPKVEPPPGWPGTQNAVGNAAAADNFTLAAGANAGAGSTVAVQTATVAGGNLSTRRRLVLHVVHAGIPTVGEVAVLTLPAAMRDAFNLVGRELPFLGVYPLNANAANSGLSVVPTLDATGTLITDLRVRASVAPAVGNSDFVIQVGDQD